MKFFASIVACSAAASPLSKVVSLLNGLADTVKKEGAEQEAQYEAFADWCKATSRELEHEIENGQSRSEQLGAAIEKAAADGATASARIEELGAAISAADADLAAATKVRSTEHTDFVAEQASAKETIDALVRAQQVLSRHLSNPDATTLAQITTSFNALVNGAMFSTSDKRRLTRFLQAESEDINQPSLKAYESHSGSIMDTLEAMQEKAEDLLAELQKSEMKAQHAFDMVKQSLENSLKASNEDMAEQRKAQAAAQEAQSEATGDKASTDKDLGSDRAQLKDTTADCQQKDRDYENSVQARSEELAAIAEATKVIADMTGGANSREYKELLQVSVRDSANLSQVEKMVKKIAREDQSVVLSQLATRIHTAQRTANPFGKVKGLIESMINKLEKEANEDASHKAFCDKETSESEAKRNKHSATVGKLSTRLDKTAATISKLKQEVATLTSELSSLAKSQAEMDSMRQANHEEFVASKKDYTDGLAGVQTALKVLRDYYSEAALVQQPEVSFHSKKGDTATGIIGLLEVTEGDFARALADAESSEAAEQQRYDKVSQDNRVAKTEKNADSAHKTNEIKSLTEREQELASDRDGVQAELDAVVEYLDKLRPQCTVVPETYEQRKARREQEIEGLKSALEVLENEAAPTFLQRKSAGGKPPKGPRPTKP